MTWFLFSLVGIVAGFFAGALGIGGGILIVPAVYFISMLQGIDPTHAMHQAIATSLLVMIFTSLSSSITHVLKKGVIWPLFRWMLLGICVGAILGPIFGVNLSSSILKIILAILEILMGILVFIKLKTKIKSAEEEKKPLTHPLIFIPFGIFIGFFASLLGIGGGIIVVPILILAGHSPHKSIATSAMTIVPTSVLGTLTYFFMAKSAGYCAFYDIINVPAFITLTIATLIATPLGAISCYKIPNKPLRIVFASLLLAIGVSFFIH